MKATTFIAILLTLLMALLVLIAAVIFLLQGRQQLETRVNAVATERAQVESTRTQLEANLGAVSEARSTSQAELDIRGAEVASLMSQVIQLEQERDAAAGALATALVPTATATPGAATLAAPTVEFISPGLNDLLPVNTSTEIIFVVYHPAGVESVHLEVGEAAQQEMSLDGEQFRRISVPFEFSETVFPVTQPLIISVVATSMLGVPTAPQLLTITVSVPAPVPTVTPTPTATSGIPAELPIAGIITSPEGPPYSSLSWAVADPRRV